MVLSLKQNVQDQKVEKEYEKGSIPCIFVCILIVSTFPHLTSIAGVVFASPLIQLDQNMCWGAFTFNELFLVKRMKKVMLKPQKYMNAYTHKSLRFRKSRIEMHKL